MSETLPTSGVRGSNARLYTLVGILFGLMFPLLATVISLSAEGLPLTLSNAARAQAQPLMWIIDTAPIFLGGLASLVGRRQDDVEAASSLLAAQARELQSHQQELEARVADRTAQLQQREHFTRQTVNTTRRLSTLHDVPELVSTAVQLVAENATGYFVDLYLIDQRREEAARAATSEGPDAPRLAVPVGDARLVGQVAASGEVGRSSVPSLAQELALPLLSRGRPMGVLHLRPIDQSAKLPADVEVLQLLADQLAAAIESSRLFGEARDAMKQLRAVAGQSATAAWKEDAGGPDSAFEFTPAGTKPIQPGATLDIPRGLRIPIELRGQRIGSIKLSRSAMQGWTESDRDLAQKTAAQVALALENVRLLQETRERALEEQRLSDFSAKLGQSVDLETLLQTAVRELAALPQVSEASIYLSPAATSTMPDAPGAERGLS